MSGKRTTREIGRAEPGFDTFARFYKESGTSDKDIEQYAGWIGSIRNRSDKPLLELSVKELKELDTGRLRSLAKSYRTILRMFYNGNERYDLIRAVPKLRGQKKRRFPFESILMPEDALAMIAAAGNYRDRALLACIYSTGGRINELLTLRMKHIVRSNGGYQLFFASTKSRGQERYSPKIESPWKEYLEAWLSAHESRNDPNAWAFPSTGDGSGHVVDSTISQLLHGLAKKAGIAKQVNAHWWRHSRISLAFARKEGDLGTICGWFWGVPVTPMANTYSHFQGLELTIETPKPIELPPVPALPVPLISQTRKEVSALTVEMESMREELRRFREEAKAKEEREAQREADFASAAIAAGYGDLLKEKGAQAVRNKVLGIE